MSLTIDGTAVAMIVESMAMRPVESITASRTGPRADRSPTLFSVTTGTYPRKAVTVRHTAGESARSRRRPSGGAGPIRTLRRAGGRAAGGRADTPWVGRDPAVGLRPVG